MPGDAELRVTVRLFAVYKDRAKKSQVVLDLPEKAVVGELVAEVARQYPGLTRRPETMVVAVNQEYRDHSFALSDGDEAALIPPVSGGSGGAE